MIPFSLMAVNMTIAPTVSNLYTEGDLHKIQQILTTSVRAILAFSLPAALVLIIFGPWLVPFVFGEDFAFAAYPLAILCIGQLINVCMGSVGIVLNMTGNEQDTARGVAIAAVVNI